MRLRAFVVALATLALGALAGVALAEPAPSPAGASALAVLVRLPSGETVSGPSATAPPATSNQAVGYAYPEGGAVVAIGSASVSAGARTGTPASAEASVELEDVSLFGGEVTIDRLAARAHASVTSGRPEGEVSSASVAGLSVFGQLLHAEANLRVELGFGTAVVLEQAIQRADGQGAGFRGFVTALHITLREAHAGLPAGTEVLVGYAEAAVRETDSAPRDGGRPDTGQGDEEPSSSPAAGGSGAESEQVGPPAAVRNPPSGVRPQLTSGRHVFPVYGQASFADDFGAPRADTIWHHGVDIVAPLGAPVLAASDGVVFSVGWNRLGGHRLWLRDDEGNEYYYAHLSAYSPLAVDGARVEAGDVLGFVGTSGAAGGIPHLHFELHPPVLAGLGYDGVVDPYEYLLTWYERRDAELDPTVVVPPAPPAVLLGGTDIATESGLDPAAVERAFAAFVGLAEGLPLPARDERPLVGGPPGF